VKLDTELWHSYFHALARGCSGALVSVEVARSPAGNGRAHPPRALRAIGYRQSEDLIRVDAGSWGRDGGLVRFFIPAPREIRVARAGHGPEILISDAAGTETLIRVFAPVGALR
jgi:hypothetical protein